MQSKRYTGTAIALYDEENPDAEPLWAERGQEAVEASTAVNPLLRQELLEQVHHMLSRNLSPEEQWAVTHHYGLGTQRLEIDQLAQSLSLSRYRTARLLDAALMKLRESDEAILIWKYLYKG